MTPGRQTHSLAGSSSSPASGDQLRLRLKTSTDRSGRWVVSTARPDDTAPTDSAGAEIDGVVSALLVGSRFVLNAVTVDASAAKVSGTLQVGTKVEVSGRLSAGVLVARQVQADRGSARTFSLSGTPGSLGTSNRRFVLRGNTVSCPRADLVFSGGSAAWLAGYAGKRKLDGVLSADRTVLDATRSQFDD